MNKIKTMENLEKIVIVFKSVPLIFKQHIKINTLENEIDVKNARIKELENIIKSDLYKDFMAKLEAPHKIIDLQNTLKIRTKQRNDLREENKKQNDEIRSLKDKVRNQDLIVKQNEKYKKQVKSLKEVIKEGK